MANNENDIERYYSEENGTTGFHRGLLGMIFAGFGLAGIIFSGLIEFGFSSFYGDLGIGSTFVWIPFGLSILLVVVGVILLIMGQKHHDEDI